MNRRCCAVGQCVYRTALRDLVNGLPACDGDGLAPCPAPATRAFRRGEGRWCDDHSPPACPDYPRAPALRSARALLATGDAASPPAVTRSGASWSVAGDLVRPAAVPERVALGRLLGDPFPAGLVLDLSGLLSVDDWGAGVLAGAGTAAARVTLPAGSLGEWLRVSLGLS